MRSFWLGFEKNAGWRGLLLPAVLGLAGSYAGGYLAGKKSSELLEAVKNHQDKKDAKALFKVIGKSVPDLHLFTASDLSKEIEKEKNPQHKKNLGYLRDALKAGNAFASYPTETFFSNDLPPVLRGKKIVGTGDQTHPSQMAHEIGHIIDFDEAAKAPALKRFYRKFLRSQAAEEEAAWSKAPGEIDTKIRDEALRSYRRSRNYVLTGALAGGGLGAAINKVLNQGASIK